MKREFLQNFKVNDQPLTKEIIDAIMAENGRDIEAAKKPFADYDSLKDQLQTAKDSLKAFEGMDVQKLQGQIAQLHADIFPVYYANLFCAAISRNSELMKMPQHLE